MISIGLDLPAGTIKEGLGPHGFVFKKILSMIYLFMCNCRRTHVLAPTAVDLVKYGQRGAILSERHSDLTFLTIHGRSRYPSLYIWTTNTDQRIRVEIPPGSNFLVQAGRQLEHITTYGHSDNELPLIVKGGPIRAGRHEVVVNDQTLAVGDSDANVFLCTHLAFLIRLLNDRRRISQIDLRLLSESRRPFSGTFYPSLVIPF